MAGDQFSESFSTSGQQGSFSSWLCCWCQAWLQSWLPAWFPPGGSNPDLPGQAQVTVTGGRNSCGFDGKDRLYGNRIKNPLCWTHSVGKWERERLSLKLLCLIWRHAVGERWGSVKWALFAGPCSASWELIHDKLPTGGWCESRFSERLFLSKSLI